MGHKGIRNACRRLVIELAVVVALVSVPVDFPRSTSTGRAWSFIGQHPLLLLHVAAGTLILAEAIGLLVGSVVGSGSGTLTRVLATLGVAFVVLAFASGLTFAATGQHDSALTAMSVGWLGSIATYGTGWAMGHRAVAAERGVNARR